MISKAEKRKQAYREAQENRLVVRISMAIIQELLLLTGESPKTLMTYLNAIQPKLIATELEFEGDIQIEPELMKIPSPAALYREFSQFIIDQKEYEQAQGIQGNLLRLRLIEIGVKYDDKYKGEPLKLLCFYDTNTSYLHIEWLTGSKVITEAFLIACIEKLQHEIKTPVGNVFITQQLMSDISPQWLMKESQTVSVIQHTQAWQPFEYQIDNGKKQYLIDVGIHRQRVKTSIKESVEKYQKTNAKKLNLIRDKFKPSTKQPAYLQQIKESQAVYQIPVQVMQWLINDAKAEQLLSERAFEYLAKLPLDAECDYVIWADVIKIKSEMVDRFGEQAAQDFEDHVTVHDVVYSYCGGVSTEEARVAYKKWLRSDQSIFLFE